jgi:hypothetical protein
MRSTARTNSSMFGQWKQRRRQGPPWTAVRGLELALRCTKLEHWSWDQWPKWLLLCSAGENRGGVKELHSRWQEGSNSLYDALNSDLFPPTQSRWYKESILLTCGGENGSQRVSGDGMVQLGFNDGGGDFRRCSGLGNCSGGGGGGRASSSKRWTSLRSFEEMDQWQWLARRWRLSWGQNLGPTIHHFIGGFAQDVEGEVY